MLYVEFAGLDAQAAAWKKTATYRMLYDTPLGAMLEEVSKQLVEKFLGFFPNHKASGADIIKLVKLAARSGWVLAVNANPKGSDDALRGTFVLRGAASKELRALSGRVMGWMMGSGASPRPDRRGERVLVLVPPGGSAGPFGIFSRGWVWWPEKEDLVIGFWHPSSADGIISALDGKTPSAAELPLVRELFKPEERIQPVCVAFADTAKSPESPSPLVMFFHRAGVEWGTERIDLRIGFDADALVTVGRLVAPKPRKGLPTLFDHPTFEKTALLPLPDGVNSFVELSMIPSQFVDVLGQTGLADEFKAHVDEFAESIRSAGKIDLRKDLLAHLGPRIAVFLSPGRSAATNDDSLESALRGGLSLTSVVSAIQSLFPKLTLVAEVNNPKSFAIALEAAMIVINNELRVQAVEAAHARANATADTSAGTGRGQAGRMGGRPERPKRRRALEHTPAPNFILTPTATATATEGIVEYVLSTPTESPLKLGPSGFRPTVHLEGKYLVIAISPAVAQSALAAVRRRDWTPSDLIQRACATVPPRLTALCLVDVTESLPSLLASFPGTLQTMINTSIAVAKARASGEQTTATGAAGAAGAGMERAGGSGPLGRGPRGRSGGPGLAQGMGPGGPARARPGGEAPAAEPAPSGGSGGATSAAAGEGMVMLNIDAAMLPNADDLRARLFPTTLVIDSSDQDVQFIWRGAFPNLALAVEFAPVAASLPAVQELLEGLRKLQAQGSTEAAATGGSASAGGASGAPEKGAGAAAGAAAGGPSTPSAAPPGKVRGKRNRRSDGN